MTQPKCDIFVQWQAKKHHFSITPVSREAFLSGAGCCLVQMQLPHGASLCHADRHIRLPEHTGSKNRLGKFPKGKHRASKKPGEHKVCQSPSFPGKTLTPHPLAPPSRHGRGTHVPNLALQICQWAQDGNLPKG